MERRTRLGEITYRILKVTVIIFIINCLLGLEIVSDFYRLGYPMLVIVLMIFIWGVIIFVLYKFLNAYRFNTPNKIIGWTLVMLFLHMRYLMLLIPNTGELLDKNSGLLILLIPCMWIVIILIILIELRFLEIGQLNNKTSSLWIVVGICAFIAFISHIVISGLLEGFINNISLGVVIQILMNLGLDISITLIACWITNQDKFYKQNSTESFDKINDFENNNYV